MNYFVASPDWGVWIIAYFYLGGIAAGAYFLAILIEWFGQEEDWPLARIAYAIAFPLVLLCTVFLIIDLGRPERFWHMMFKSEVARAALAAGFPWTGEGWRLAGHAPMFKYWSPMSAGSWGLAVFGACSAASFLTAVWPERRVGRWLRRNPVHGTLQVIGCVAGFFIAVYTGGLLSATNQPMWSDTTWLAPLFLASAASTGLATMSLIARWKNLGTPEARKRLEGAEPLALGLELIVLGAFVASLSDNLNAVLGTVRGNLLVFGTPILAILIPLLLHARIGHRQWWGMPAAAVCVLLGGLLLRYSAIMTPDELLRTGPSAAVRFAPEERRRHGQYGADVRNVPPEGPQPKVAEP
jgi:formate-dependent nitrite reductase membrane component NrfD